MLAQGAQWPVPEAPQGPGVMPEQVWEDREAGEVVRRRGIAATVSTVPLTRAMRARANMSLDRIAVQPHVLRGRFANSRMGASISSFAPMMRCASIDSAAIHAKTTSIAMAPRPCAYIHHSTKTTTVSRPSFAEEPTATTAATRRIRARWNDATARITIVMGRWTKPPCVLAYPHVKAAHVYAHHKIHAEPIASIRIRTTCIAACVTTHVRA